jgi:hypothetical protein
MAVTVTPEDGSVVAGANSYNTRAEGDTYFANRPSASWNDASNDEKDEALVVGCSSFDNAYNWIGDISTDDDDRLLWPRENATGASDRTYDGIIPRQLKEGHLEYAELFLNGDLDLNLDREVLKEVVGPIEVEYAEGSKYKAHPHVDNLVSDLSTGKPGGPTKLVRF